MKQAHLFLITGTGKWPSDQNPFLQRVAQTFDCPSHFFMKKELGTIPGNLVLAEQQLRDIQELHQPKLVVVIGHSEGGMLARRLVARHKGVVGVGCNMAVCTGRDLWHYQAIEHGKKPDSWKKSALALVNALPTAIDEWSPEIDLCFRRIKELDPHDEVTDPMMLELENDPTWWEYSKSIFLFDTKTETRSFSNDVNRRIGYLFSRIDLITPPSSIEVVHQWAPQSPIAVGDYGDHNFMKADGTVSQEALDDLVKLVDSLLIE